MFWGLLDHPKSLIRMHHCRELAEYEKVMSPLGITYLRFAEDELFLGRGQIF